MGEDFQTVNVLVLCNDTETKDEEWRHQWLNEMKGKSQTVWLLFFCHQIRAQRGGLDRLIMMVLFLPGRLLA